MFKFISISNLNNVDLQVEQQKSVTDILIQ